MTLVLSCFLPLKRLISHGRARTKKPGLKLKKRMQVSQDRKRLTHTNIPENKTAGQKRRGDWSSSPSVVLVLVKRHAKTASLQLNHTGWMWPHRNTKITTSLKRPRNAHTRFRCRARRLPPAILLQSRVRAGVGP